MQTIIVATRKFVNRSRELELLRRRYASSRHEVIVVYGRRRVGKTVLVKKSLEGYDHIYFLCSNRSIHYNLKKFSEKVSEHIGIPKTVFNDFRDAFKALLSKGDNIVVVLDEFGYLVEKDKGILSDFQEIIDELLANTRLKLVLCGSTISLMESEILGYKSPLYGRSTLQLKVKPLELEAIFEWFPNLEFEEAFKLYAVTGGVPKYLEFFRGEHVVEEIVENFFDPYSFLYNDALNILSEELRDYATYLQILEAIALGYNRITEIANYAFIQAKDAYFYLKVLRSLDIIERITPLLAPRKTKRGIYEFKDYYFYFWFKFLSPYQTDIEGYNPQPAIENFHTRFNEYLAKVFEKTARDIVLKLSIIRPTRIGKWWHKNVEIDVVALNDNTREIIFGEVKWSDNVDPEKEAEKLVEKANYVEWSKSNRKEYLLLIAKSFKYKIDEFMGRRTYCIDLVDLEKLFKTRDK